MPQRPTTMANLFMSLSGDGRGHATRVRALVEALRPEHQLTLHTSGQGFMFLAKAYAGSEVKVRRIGCLRFGYDRRGNLDIRRTAAGAARYLQRLPDLLRLLRTSLERDQPDLVISDFEPALPRAACDLGIPHISLNHQHFLLTYDLRTLPWWLQARAVYMGWVVRAYDCPAAARIVSSFYFPPLRPGCQGVTQIGVLLRPLVEAAASSAGDHLVAYWRRHTPPGALEALDALGREVRVYGLGRQDPRGNLRFMEASETQFVSDLASCAALMCNAGNQLVGEAIYLRKPVFVIPESGNYEQYINAHFVRQMNAGEWAEPHQVTEHRLRQFISRSDQFSSNIAPPRMNGLPAALARIRAFLHAPTPQPPSTEPIPA